MKDDTATCHIRAHMLTYVITHVHVPYNTCTILSKGTAGQIIGTPPCREAPWSKRGWHVKEAALHLLLYWAGRSRRKHED